METETVRAFAVASCSLLSPLALSWGAGVLILGRAPQEALALFRSVREYGWHFIGLGVVFGLMAIAVSVGGWLLLLFLPAFVLLSWLNVRLIGRRSKVLLLRLDRTTAKDLAALLDEAGESLVTGKALTPRSNAECVRLGRVLHDLQRRLGPTPLGSGKLIRQNQRLGSAQQRDRQPGE
ncbi:MAG TPA: hypothetical protein VFX61_02030 [Micromonosporaceae bacterium]|nr:hypothetical protein [Micromonosporaceae bacterium]